VKTIKVLIVAALGMIVGSCGGARDISGSKAPKAELPTIGELAGPLGRVEAKKLFGTKSSASSQSPAAFGNYAKGCMAGGVQLAETGPTWQAMRLSRNRNWGHPELVDMVTKLSQFAAQQPGWNGLYIGDMSQPRGGPMLTGHRSHQIGLDADIWMLPPTSLSLTRKQRENISSISTRRAKGAYVNNAWTRSHHEIIKAAAKDPRVERIFVFPGAKVQMCDDERGNRAYLRKIRPWYGHHYHFHVRLACPSGVRGCVNQNPPPAGDGCDDAREWQANILNPPKAKPQPKPKKPAAPRKPRRELTLSDLPAQCQAVLESR
jgi:penicillin-insensitive murein DD-endopeptidase